METEFIQWLRKQVTQSPCAPLGLTDDAAVLNLQDRHCVVTSDMLMDGVDFEIDRCEPHRAGRKALAVNLSDLAAMVVRPLAAIVSLALPRAGGRQLAEQLYAGLIPLAEQFGTVIAGGDTNSWDGPLVVSVTALGQLTDRGPLRRSGARPGDAVLVTGQFGGSILGKHFDFQPRVHEAMFLLERFSLHAGMDVSDGLTLDLSRLASESGCGVVLDLDTIPLAPAALQLAAQSDDGRTALDHALADGEDFELILAVPAEEANRLVEQQPLDVALTCIGRCVDQPGLWQTDADGRFKPIEPRGYEHRLDA